MSLARDTGASPVGTAQRRGPFGGGANPRRGLPLRRLDPP